jgi:hypothetical protein
MFADHDVVRRLTAGVAAIFMYLLQGCNERREKPAGH